MATIIYKDGEWEKVEVSKVEIQPSGVLITIVGGIRSFISSDAIREITFDSDETVIPFGEGKKE
ncbi:MAG: hypothetical protein HY731_01720 [Candidatus Tectomicrobia bacterium]|nr:hypothetical protein [Candidatus Tectomicrobia bacterium]